MIISKYRLLQIICTSIIIGWAINVFAFEAFTVKDIRLEGLRRISPGTVFNYLPVTKGELFDKDKSKLALNALFKEGLFKDIRFEREEDVLVVYLEERPALSKISFEGNKAVETDKLKEALEHIGFSEGGVFNRSILEKVELELQREYFDLGKYSVKIESIITPLPRNRVAVNFKIEEGLVATIHQINFVGNNTIPSSELLDEIESTTGGWFSWLTSDNQYSRQKLAADLETIRTYYLDRGYVNFNIDSTQVTISPDKKDVYLTINLTEGDKFTVSGIKLVGNLIIPEEELLKKITVKPGSVFSNKEITANTEAITDRLGDEGYSFANINVVPDVNSEDRTVLLNLFIDPGKQVYVRRINYKGNAKTRDEVLRREMRQMESGVISTKNVKRSQERLERLGYFETVEVETPVVPETTDQVDVNYKVVEMPSGNILAGLGYSQTYGVLFNASIVQDNVLGTGKRVGITFSNSELETVYNLSYFDPYTTIDGVSRGINLYYRTIDAEEANLSYYSTNEYGGKINYGIPVSEYNSITTGFEYNNTELNTTSYSPKEVHDFVKENGNTYNSYRLSAFWRYDTRNSTIFPERGVLQTFSADVVLPFSDLTYYKTSFHHQWLRPIVKDYIFLLEGEVAYGDGYGEDGDMPFFENYTAGGPRSVRGFKENTLGPLDSNDRPLGGNLKVVGNAEIILPVPFTKKIRSLRLSAFVDVGNIYGTGEQFDASLFRYSTGISVIWLSPIGMMTFSLAKPLKTEKGDQTQMFQFNIGTTF